MPLRPVLPILSTIGFHSAVLAAERPVLESKPGRGFIRFQVFSSLLTTLYRRREPGTPVSDLYPEIIAWFDDNRAPGPLGRRWFELDQITAFWEMPCTDS